MNENFEQDMAILAKIRREKESANVSKDWNENDSDFIENQKDLILLERTLRLNQWSQEALTQLKGVRSRFRISYIKTGIAAGVALILSLAYLALNQNYNSDLILTENSLRTDKQSTVNQANEPQKQAYTYFLEGKASYHAKEYDRAIKNYQKALKTPALRNQFREAIEWHLCVAYLLNNQPLESEKILKKIERNPNPKFVINKMDLLKLKTQLWLKK
ncbi:MAG TPA: hypothetical protein VK175_16760 [Leadbetterella sp.]|nr:hypothetical protein [Leadbetterella sp.]